MERPPLGPTHLSTELAAGERWRAHRHPGAPDRSLVQTELEETRARFHELIVALPAEAWDRPSVVPSWTVGEVAVHITSYLTIVIPTGVAAAREGRRWGGLPPWIAHSPLGDRLNQLGTRWLARDQNAQSVLLTYERAHLAVLQLLHWMPDSDWHRRTYTLGRVMSVGELFHIHAAHFEDHRPHIAQARDAKVLDD